MQRIVTGSIVKEDGVIAIECVTADQNTLLENGTVNLKCLIAST